jgi:uncharacterized membrane protein SpoIIM required for sporulation
MATPSTLTEAAFAERRRAEWDELEVLVARSGRKVGPDDASRLPPLYRSLCSDLAAAQTARYSAGLVDYLLDLTAAAHAVVYGPAAATRRGLVRNAWLVAFPQAVRARWRAMLLATALFFVPFALGVALAHQDPTFAYRVVPEAMLRPLAEAYARGFGAGREPGEGLMMAGFYVYNNVGIALRCFALGIFGGVGSAFYLVHNGLSIGAVLGYVAAEGAARNVVVFILGHGSLELGAIVLSGGAGLSLGWSVVAPGDRSRLASLQARAREVVVIVLGAAAMLVLAALIEAFWSASSVDPTVKTGVGGALLLLVASYVAFAGRSAVR